MNQKRRSILATIILLVLVFVIIPLAFAAVLGDFRKDLSEVTRDAGYPKIALNSDGSKVGVVWTERVTANAIIGSIYFRGGTTAEGASGGFQAAKVLVDQTTGSSDQSLTADIAASGSNNDQMHVVWRNLSANNRILLKTCTISTASCLAEKVVDAHTDPETIAGDTLNDPAIATSAGSAIAHVVWQDSEAAGNKLIYYRAGNPAVDPSTWAAKGAVAIDNRASKPAIVATSSAVYVVWVNDSDSDGLNEQVKYVKSATMSGGVVTSWGSPKSMPPPTGTAGVTWSDPDNPTIVAIDDTVIALWDVFKGSENDLDGAGEPKNEIYYGVFAASFNAGSDNFEAYESNGIHTLNVGADLLAEVYTERRSDDLLGNATPFDEFVHGRRLQMQASFVPTTTAGITGTLHVVWHETTVDNPNPGYHDVLYASLNVGTCGLPCGQWNDVRGADSNETTSRKAVDPKAYSLAPDIEVEPNGNKKYVVYMEGDEGSEFDVADVLYNIFFNSTENLTVTSNPSPTPDATDIAANPKILLPIILKQ